MAAETSNEEFMIFSRAVQASIDLFGLKDWNVTVRHDFIERPVYATVSTDHVGRVAVITFNKARSEDGDYNPAQTGRHEVLELLLSPLVRLASSRYILPEDIETETHAIIRRLEKLTMT